MLEFLYMNNILDKHLSKAIVVILIVFAVAAFVNLSTDPANDLTSAEEFELVDYRRNIMRALDSFYEDEGRVAVSVEELQGAGLMSLNASEFISENIKYEFTSDGKVRVCILPTLRAYLDLPCEEFQI